MGQEEITTKVQNYFANYPLRDYGKGQILIQSDDEPRHIFFVLSGKVRQYDISYRGDEVVVNVFREGAFFPMLWALTQLPNRFFFAAETDVQVRLAPYQEVLEFMHANPEVTYDLLRRLYTGVDGLLGRMTHLMAGSAKSRLLYELIIECRRFGKPQSVSGYVLAVKEAELGSYAGLSRETVSRELQKLVRDGLIVVTRQGIEIKSLPGLEERLGTEL